MTIAWAFPGQGSQKIGMANHVISLPGAKERFETASEIIGRDLLAICNGESSETEPLADLNDTRNTQPALFVIESILVDDMHRQGREAALVAGHSLGELVALYAAGVFDAKTALSLLHRRSELMAAAGGGAMCAILGFKREELETLVNATEGVVIANDNSDSQVVLSGNPQSVSLVTNQLECKRSIPLSVSGAFHSPFMEEASRNFSKELDQIHFENSRIPVISNADPMPSSDGNLLKEKLKLQMTNGVRWRETMNTMLNEGVSSLIEIGPGNVLSGLAKRSMKGVITAQISTVNDLGH